MATTYTDTTMGARAIGARTDSAGAAVFDMNAEEERYPHEVLTPGWLAPVDSFEPVSGAGATMNVILGSGVAKLDHYVIQGANPGQGRYLVRHDATTTTVTLAAANASLPRKDEIYLVVEDDAYDGSGRALPRFAYRNGVAASSPVAPGPDIVWDAYVLLATVDVPGAAADILACTITDERIPSTIEVGGFESDADHVGAGAGAHAPATPSVAGFVSGADKTKLDGVEALAEVNPSAASMLTDIKTLDGPGSGVDADKLDGLQASQLLLVGGKAADTNLLDGLNSTAFATASHGAHVTANAVDHDDIVTLLEEVQSTTAQNIGSSLTPLTLSPLVLPSKGAVIVKWGIRLQKTGASGSGNYMFVLPRDDGNSNGTFNLQYDLDGAMPNQFDYFYFSGSFYVPFGAANTSTYDLTINKTGPTTFDFTRGFLSAQAFGL